MPLGAALLAHQGGWDEILLVVGPMLVIVALLRLAKRRVEQVEKAKQAETAQQAEHAAAADERPPT